jgi:hypothetical protein
MSRRRKWLVGISATILLGLAYLGSFFLLRRGISVMTELPTSFSYAGCIEIRYFSSNPTINGALYTLYWPIHRLIGEDERFLEALALTETHQKRREMVRDLIRRRRAIYVRHVARFRDEWGLPF